MDKLSSVSHDKRRMRASVPTLHTSGTLLGVACGTGAALFWALGLAIGRHGILVGFASADIVFHRFVWAGLIFLPFFARDAVRWIGWRRSVWLPLAGGPLLAFLRYAGC